MRLIIFITGFFMSYSLSAQWNGNNFYLKYLYKGFEAQRGLSYMGLDVQNTPAKRYLLANQIQGRTQNAAFVYGFNSYKRLTVPYSMNIGVFYPENNKPVFVFSSQVQNKKDLMLSNSYYSYKNKTKYTHQIDQQLAYTSFQNELKSSKQFIEGASINAMVHYNINPSYTNKRKRSWYNTGIYSSTNKYNFERQSFIALRSYYEQKTGKNEKLRASVEANSYSSTIIPLHFNSENKQIKVLASYELNQKKWNHRLLMDFKRVDNRFIINGDVKNRDYNLFEVGLKEIYQRGDILFNFDQKVIKHTLFGLLYEPEIGLQYSKKIVKVISYLGRQWSETYLENRYKPTLLINQFPLESSDMLYNKKAEMNNRAQIEVRLWGQKKASLYSSASYNYLQNRVMLNKDEQALTTGDFIYSQFTIGHLNRLVNNGKMNLEYTFRDVSKTRSYNPFSKHEVTFGYNQQIENKVKFRKLKVDFNLITKLAYQSAYILPIYTYGALTEANEGFFMDAVVNIRFHKSKNYYTSNTIINLSLGITNILDEKLVDNNFSTGIYHINPLLVLPTIGRQFIVRIDIPLR